MTLHQIMQIPEQPARADTSALGAINRRLLVRLASFGAGEIPSEAIWIDANR